jgi:hypothetical protein
MKQKFLKNLGAFSLVVIFLLLAYGSDSSDKGVNYNNGEGMMKHDSSKDWDAVATRRKIGERVWKFAREHSDATSLFVSITDECTDRKGNVSKNNSHLFFTEEDLREFATYQDDYSFNHNCTTFILEISEWQQCGNVAY